MTRVDGTRMGCSTTADQNLASEREQNAKCATIGAYIRKSETQGLSPGQTRKHCCGKNICDSRGFLKCFPVCPPVETLLRKQNLLPEKQKCFLANSETFDLSYVSH
jgi:hypothetical protein